MQHTIVTVCFKYGLFLEKVHKVTKVIQRNWLEPYISLNTTKCMADTKN